MITDSFGLDFLGSDGLFNEHWAETAAESSEAETTKEETKTDPDDTEPAGTSAPGLWRERYRETVREAADAEEEPGYWFLHDFDGDGIPEMIAGGFMTTLYTFGKDGIRQLRLPANHGIIYWEADLIAVSYGGVGFSETVYAEFGDGEIREIGSYSFTDGKIKYVWRGETLRDGDQMEALLAPYGESKSLDHDAEGIPGYYTSREAVLEAVRNWQEQGN